MKILVCLFTVMALALTAAAADVTGKWSGSYTQPNGNTAPAYVVLKQSGTTLTGTAGGSAEQSYPLQQGKIQGDKLSFQVTTDQGVVYKCDATVNGDNLKGDLTVTRDGQTMKAPLELKRVKP